jgi:hypothetical protein
MESVRRVVAGFVTTCVDGVFCRELEWDGTITGEIDDVAQA